MTTIMKRFTKSVTLRGESTDVAETSEGLLFQNSSDLRIKAYIEGAVRQIVTNSQAQVLTNKTIDADTNTVSNIQTTNLKSGVLNTSTSLTGATDTQIPSALAVKTYVNTTASGEANTASNLGATGEGVFAQKVAADLQFKKLKSGTNLTLTSDASSITINSTGGSSASLTETSLTNFPNVLDSRTNLVWGMAGTGTGQVITIGDTAGVANKVRIVGSTTATTAAFDGTFRRLAYGNGTYVAGNRTTTTTTNAIMTSTNGTTWTARTLPAIRPISGIAFGAGVFVAVSDSISTQSILVSSNNGVTWTAITHTAATFLSLRYINNQFVAYGGLSSNGNDVIFTSTNGTTWTQINPTLAGSPLLNYVNFGATPDPIYGNSIYLATDTDSAGNVRVIVSNDLQTWAVSSTTHFGLGGDFGENGKVFIDGYFVGLRDFGGGGISITSDGITIKTLTHSKSFILGIFNINGRLYVVGAGPIIGTVNYNSIFSNVKIPS